MRTCSGHQGVVHDRICVELRHVSAYARFGPTDWRGGKILQRYYIQKDRYSQQIILVNTPQNRTNNAFPACDSTGQYGHLTRLATGTGQQDAVQGDMKGPTLQTCSTSASYPSSQRVHIPSSSEDFAPLIVPWRQDKQISSGTGFLPATVFRSVGCQQDDHKETAEDNLTGSSSVWLHSLFLSRINFLPFSILASAPPPPMSATTFRGIWRLIPRLAQ